ncbi:hypothetical protein [Aestuariibaculum marinum]|uniref:Uncharacterized protein n=1 Tax=Aestuariibaculum marinum TaxID=2683592 RepID=A0A8J6PX79_9FLAO|nr:hypothetical protein [Aestuariibaculum marinum]MBD0822735.1 hypothetical protein [Aestuariibaculum marinum]
MPKQNGIIKLKGVFNGVSYYKLNGVYVARKAVGPSKERINSDPAFIKVKANNQEFAAASMLSKALRAGLGNNAKYFKDTYMASRLTGCCLKIVQKGSGNLGQREANIHNNTTALIGFQLNKDLVFNKLISVKPIVTNNSKRTRVSINIPKITAKTHKKLPKNHTHVQLTAALSVVSNYVWQSDLNTYIPEFPAINALGSAQQSHKLLCKIEHKNINLNLESPVNNSIPKQVAVMVWLGITYFQKLDNQFIPQQTAKAMVCVAVV